MKYKVQNIHVLTATNERGEYQWLQADLFNDQNPFANPNPLPRYYSMTPAVIKIFEPWLEPAKDAKGNIIPGDKVVNEVSMMKDIEEKKCPFGDVSHIDHVFRYVHPLEGAWARIYPNDVVDDKGTTIHKKGEFVIAKNQTKPTPVTQLALYLPQAQDSDTGAWDFVDDPSTVARRVLEKNYVPLEMTPASNAPQQPAPTTQSATQQDVDAETLEKFKKLQEQGLI